MNGILGTTGQTGTTGDTGNTGETGNTGSTDNTIQFVTAESAEELSGSKEDLSKEILRRVAGALA